MRLLLMHTFKVNVSIHKQELGKKLGSKYSLNSYACIIQGEYKYSQKEGSNKKLGSKYSSNYIE
jgi:hypothetical protein